MDSIDDQVTENLAAFEKTQEPAFVYRALDLIEATERDLAMQDRTARRQALARRLRFFETLDRAIDPSWNAERKPVMGVPPPPSSTGIVYGSGEVDPAGIADPAERAEYERALQTTKDYYRWYDLQLQLRRLDERAMRFVELFLAGRYTSSKADRREVEQLLAASTIGEPRKGRLRSFMRGPR